MQTLIKPEAVLHVAYNDALGITVVFNKNILNSVNDLIKSNFQTSNFKHLAFFDKEKFRIEMHLLANGELSVRSTNFMKDLQLKEGEAIHTDERGWFALTEFQKD